MKKEETISTLITIKMLFDNTYARKALDVAIEALEERPTGKWVGVQEYCKHLEEKTGERYAPTGWLEKLVYCNQCWQANNRHSAYCPNCGAAMDISE